jgi:tagatose-1,6-bisphosphate aldolase
MIAEARSLSCKYRFMNLNAFITSAPQKVREAMPRFIDKAIHYFKVGENALPVYAQEALKNQ